LKASSSSCELLSYELFDLSDHLGQMRERIQITDDAASGQLTAVNLSFEMDEAEVGCLSRSRQTFNHLIDFPRKFGGADLQGRKALEASKPLGDRGWKPLEKSLSVCIGMCVTSVAPKSGWVAIPTNSLCGPRNCFRCSLTLLPPHFGMWTKTKR
jgi:hypothetical protein